jgi:hypothetical protein
VAVAILRQPSGTKPGVLTGSSVRDDGNASHGSHRTWPAYVLPNRPRDRFISPGEPTGRGICSSAAGQGINASTEKPPRYSDATLGDCVHQFAVRDDAPERSPPKSN